MMDLAGDIGSLSDYRTFPKLNCTIIIINCFHHRLILLPWNTPNGQLKHSLDQRGGSDNGSDRGDCAHY